MWYKTFFDKDYVKHLKEASNDKARDFQLSLIKKYLKKSDMVLDVACGYGRHLITLTEEGYNIIGLDLSPDMLDDLKTNCDKAQVVLSDMRSFSFPFKFDFIYCMFSSFGYFADPQDDLKVILEISKNLKAGGLFLLDLKNSTKTFQEKMEKKVADKIHDYTINRYSQDDISKMLKEAGLQPFQWYGDYTQVKYDADSPRMIIFSKKS